MTETNVAERNGTPVITPEKEINNQLQQKNLADEAIAGLKEKYGSLTLTDINDEVTLNRIHAARMEVKQTRIGVEKFCKQAREHANAYSKAVSGEEKRLVNLILPLEEKLQAEEDKPAKEKDRIRLEEEAKAELRFKQRVEALVNCGMNFDGSFYFLKDLRIATIDIRTMPDDGFVEFLSSIQAEQQKVLAEKEQAAAEAKRVAEEQARVRKEQQEKKAEFDRIAAEQKAKQDEIERQQQEINKQQRNIRTNLLQSIGMFSQLNGYEYKSIKISWEEIESLDASAFSHEVESLKGRIAALKIQENKAAENKKRMEKLIELGLMFNGDSYVYDDINFHWSEVITMTEAEFDKQLEGAKKRKEQIISEKALEAEKLRKENEEKERQRVAALAPDKEKLALWAIELRDFKQPGELQSSEANEVCTRANEMINDVCTFITNEISKLK